MRFSVLFIAPALCSITPESRRVWPGIDVTIGGDNAKPGFYLHGLVVPNENAALEVATTLAFVYTKKDDLRPLRGQIVSEVVETSASFMPELVHVACLWSGKVYGQGDIRRNSIADGSNILSGAGPYGYCEKLADLWNSVSTSELPSGDISQTEFQSWYSTRVDMEERRKYYFKFINSNSAEARSGTISPLL